MADAYRNIWSPTASMIPRIADAVSFLYLDRLQVTQDDTGVCARKYRKGRPPETMYLPVAQIATILLGPGTSVTTRAMSTMQRNGCTVVWVGDGGVRTYASAAPETASTTWLEHQARAWADPATRTTVVKRMFAYRFGNSIDVTGKTIEQMRGMEGARMKQLYHVLGKEHGIKAFKRSYDPADWDRQDPVNKALSAANLCLYGITGAAIAAMGCSPSLGFLHTGKTNAFVYDIADLYKAELTVPLAFGLHESSDPERHARQSFRTDLKLFKLMPRIVGDIKHVLIGEAAPDRDHTDGSVMLWDGENGPVASGVNYAGQLHSLGHRRWGIHMSSLIVIVSTSVPPKLNGTLSRWMVQIKPGVFVGRASARVRDHLWDTTVAHTLQGSSVMVYQDASDQGYALKSVGENRIKFEDFDGFTLPVIKDDNETVKYPWQSEF